MRAAGFTVQQALTLEAASIIKQAVTLARRRGHAQVTPLHVANTMLSASTGLLRTACLQSNSHPLQCRALELCFNVALNRLPASSSNPMLGSHSQHPSISNALVAAFKRAQAHQRRGSIENQQQPLLAVKIEIEQLIISILDDPSVSRVMREAGFSSTLVKSNVEQAVSLELCAQNQNPPQISNTKESTNLLTDRSSRGGNGTQARNEDVMSVIESLSQKKKQSLVIVGECIASIEGVIGRVMEKIDKGDVPEALRDLKFMSLPLFSFGHLSRRDVEEKLGELKCQVKGCLEKGVVLYLGDLKWITEFRASSSSVRGRSLSYYCPIEHLVVELGRLIYGVRQSSEKFWLMGIASFQTYMKCKSGQNSLSSVWSLQPLAVPAGSLSLSLLPESDVQSECGSKKPENLPSWLMLESGDQEEKELNCYGDCTPKCESEAEKSRNNEYSTLPSWLKNEKNRPKNNNDQECGAVKEVCKKWTSMCTSLHKQPESNERTLTFSSLSPSSSTSCFSYDHQNSNPNQTWPVFQPRKTTQEHQFWGVSAIEKTCEPSLRMYIPDHPKHGFLSRSNPNSTPNSTSSSDNMEMDYVQRFKEFNAENLKTLCNALENKVPWQKDIIPEIAGAVLQCRSGMLRRKEKFRCDGEAKEETWFFFQGIDTQAKEKIARELARVVFGSHSYFVSIALSNFSSTRADSIEDMRNKRSRDEQSCSYIERFAEAVSTNSHRVFFVEDIEQADYCSQMGIKRAIQKGKIKNSNGDEVSLSDAIIILSCESFSSRSRACSPPVKQKSDHSVEEEKGLRSEDTSPCVSLDLNMSFEEEGGEENSIDDIGLLECVDRCIVFKHQEL